MNRPAGLTGLVLLLATTAGQAQTPAATVAAERAAFADWLTSSPLSPLAVVAQRPISPATGLVVGPPDGDLPIERFPRAEVKEQRGMVTLRANGQSLALPRGRPVPFGGYRFMAAGIPGRQVLFVYGPPGGGGKPPQWFDHDPAMVLTVTLEPPESHRVRRLLGADGVEVEATEAGTVEVRLGGQTTRLTVRRLPGPDGEEQELEIYFRDPTNDVETYPAGRFVTLVPAGGNRYRLDFNRARNPFCAYSTVFACPAPWRGNRLPARVTAGERYAGGGLTPPALDDVP